MYISNLQIQNYRNFKNFSIQLKPLTLIIGENNIGKSNLIDSIGLILSQEVSFFKRRVLELSDFNHDCIVALKRQILDTSISEDLVSYPEIRVTITFKDWDEDQEAVIGDWYSNTACTEATLTYQFALISTFNKLDEVKQQRKFIEDHKTKIGEEAFDLLNEKEKLSIINIPISKYYYTIFGGIQRDTQGISYNLNQIKFELLDALRDAKTELTASHASRLLFRILNTENESEYQDFKTQLIGLQKVVDDNPALKGIKDRISEQLNKISLIDEH